jgi:hypothetical protein
LPMLSDSMRVAVSDEVVMLVPDGCQRVEVNREL